MRTVYIYLNTSECVLFRIVWFEPQVLLNYLSFYLAVLLFSFFSSHRESSIFYICVARPAFSCSSRWKLQGVWELLYGILYLYTIIIQNFAYCWTLSLFPGRRGVAILGKVRWDRRIAWRDHPIRHGPGQCYIALLTYWIRKSCP